jgi:hypothetical protein
MTGRTPARREGGNRGPFGTVLDGGAKNPLEAS